MSEVSIPKPDPLAPFRALLGGPTVAVQFAVQVPYVQIAPALDSSGRPHIREVSDPETGNIARLGYPYQPTPAQIQSVAIGTLRASECGTLLVIEEMIALPGPTDDAPPVGAARMDIYARPEAVAFVSVVKQIEMRPVSRILRSGD